MYLGGASGLATTAATTLTGEATGNYFGSSVATAGDVNGDGYADVVVGAYGYSGSTGRAYVYLGGPSGLATTAATTLTGEAADNYFGYSVATAGDVNGDGYADVVVGAHGYSSYTGRAYVYLGGPSGLATTAATTLTGEATGNYFGHSVATAGDVNGDGYADVVVGARGYSSSTGRAYVYLGGASGLATTAATTLTGEAADNYFGYSVATAGDVNGDGYADVVVGAYGYSSGTGRAYVYLGGASGLATTAATTLTGEAARQLLRLVGGDGGGCERGRLRGRGGRGAWLQRQHRAGVCVSGGGERPGDDGGDDADGRGDLQLLRQLGGDGGGCERGRLRGRGGRGVWLQQRHRAGVCVCGQRRAREESGAAHAPGGRYGARGLRGPIRQRDRRFGSRRSGTVPSAAPR